MSGIFEYRLAAGWISKVTLEGSDSYLLEQFPLQWDQPSLFAVPWMCLSDAIEKGYPDYRAYDMNADGTRSPNGDIIWEWQFAYLTEGMINYLKATIFGSQQNSQITVKTRIKSAASAPLLFACYQCYASIPPENDSKRVQGGAFDYKLNFYAATLL